MRIDSLMLKFCFNIQALMLCLGHQSGVLTLIREFLGPSPSAISGKKSKIKASDVAVGAKKIKLFV